MSSRADFGLIRPVARYISNTASENVDLLYLGATEGGDDAFLQEGIQRVRIHRLLAGSDLPSHMATPRQTIARFGEANAATADWLAAQQPGLDWLIVPGDRFEIFGATIAAYYSHNPIAHLFAGDRTLGGHMDDNVRHAISKLAHVLFPVCSDSETRLLNLGEERWRVVNAGSPVVESVREVVDGQQIDLGQWVTPRKYNLMCTYHPITTEQESAGRQFRGLLDGIERAAAQADIACIFTHPNNEVGSEQILAELRRIEGRRGFAVHASLGWRNYLRALSRCDLVVGNSSSALLEAPILGIPALDVGTRQKGRYAPAGVFREESYDPQRLAQRILEILGAGLRGRIGHPYGSGETSRRIHDTLATLCSGRSRREILQKPITY